MFTTKLIVLSYHRFEETDSDYRFSRTYYQFGHDIAKKEYDWITIDDGMKCMIRACEMLRHCNIRAKLFICPSLIGQPGYCTWEDIKALSKYHDIENHGQVHVRHTKMEKKQITSSIKEAGEAIAQVTGRRPRYFVPPYNDTDRIVEAACRELKITLVKNRVNILNISK